MHSDAPPQSDAEHWEQKYYAMRAAALVMYGALMAVNTNGQFSTVITFVGSIVEED